MPKFNWFTLGFMLGLAMGMLLILAGQFVMAFLFAFAVGAIGGGIISLAAAGIWFWKRRRK